MPPGAQPPSWRMTRARGAAAPGSIRPSVLVGDTGIEPVTSSVSGKRAPAAPIARCGGQAIHRRRRRANEVLVRWITALTFAVDGRQGVMVFQRPEAGRWNARGCGSVGRASPCQGEGRGFESRHPLRGAGSLPAPSTFTGGLAERLGTGLQSRLHRFESGTHLGRLAQRERASLTRKRSLVRSQYRPPPTRCTLPAHMLRAVHRVFFDRSALSALGAQQAPPVRAD